MSHRTLIVAFGLIAVLTGILALLDGRIAAIYGCFCVGFAIAMIDLAERPTPTVHERVRSNRARRYAAAKRNIRSI